MVLGALPAVIVRLGAAATALWDDLGYLGKLIFFGGLGALAGAGLALAVRELRYARDQLDELSATAEERAAPDWPLTDTALQIAQLHRDYTPAVFRVAMDFVDYTFATKEELDDAYNELTAAAEEGVIYGEELATQIYEHWLSETVRLAEEEAAAEAEIPMPETIAEQAEAIAQATAAILQETVTPQLSQISTYADQARWAAADAYKYSLHNVDLTNFYEQEEIARLDSIQTQQLIADQELGRVAMLQMDLSLQTLNGIRTAEETVTKGLTDAKEDTEKVLIEELDKARDVIVDDIADVNATVKNVEEVQAKTAADVEGISADVTPLAAAATTGVLSTAGLTSILNRFAGQSASAHHNARLSCMQTTTSSLLSSLVKGAMPMLLPAAFLLSDDLQDAGAAIAKKGWDILMTPLTREAPIDPEEAPTIGVTIFTEAALAGMAAHVTSITAENYAPLKHIGMGYLAGFLADMGAFGRISAATLGIMVTQGLSWPMRYYANWQTRPMMLSERDFTQLLSRRAFDRPEALQNPELEASVRAVVKGDAAEFEERTLGYYGYRSDYYGFFKELANTPLRYFPLAAIARTGFWDETWFWEALSRSGYSETAKTQLMDMYRATVQEESKGTGKGIVNRRFREGMIDDKQFMTEMEILGYPENQTDQYLLQARLEAAYDDTMDLIDAYRQQVRKKKTNLDEFRQQLLGIGILPEKAELYVVREEARLKAEEED